MGRSRTFILHQAGEVKIPTDLAGVISASYDWPRSDGNYQAAVGAACDSIRGVIRDLGVSDIKTTKVISNLTLRQEQQQKELSTHQAAIRSLQVALQGIVTQYELEKLVGLSEDEPFLCYYSEDLFDELKRLRAMSLIQNHQGVGVQKIRIDYKDKNERFDLKRFSTSLGKAASI